VKDTVLEVRLKVSPSEIYYVSWNLDACEGLGLLRTDDASGGRVTIFTPYSQLKFVIGFIDGHRAEGMSIEIDEIRECINEEQ